MAIKQERVQVQGPDGAFGAYVAAPEGGSGPGVVVIQEIFGVNEHIRSVCDRYAEAGYAAMAPDLYWRVQPGYETGYSPEEIAQGREIRGRLDDDDVVRDVGATFEALGKRPECQGRKLGIVGYCWGGLITYLAAARLSPAAASSYYGGGIANKLEEMKNITCPTQFHFGELDQAISLDDVEHIRAAAEGMSHVEVFVYPQAEHGFNCDMRGSYNPEAARLAQERTFDLFGKHLK